MESTISVVIPFYNGNDYFQDCLSGLVNQTKAISELIIVIDNDSEDPILDPESLSFPVKIIRNLESENGAGLCRYYGFKEASSRFVAFLDPDDFWHQDKVFVQMGYMLNNDLGFTFSSYQNFSEEGNGSIISPKGPFTMDGFLNKRFTIGCLTVVIDKHKLPKLEKNYLKRRNDYFMWFNAFKYMDSNGIKWQGMSDVLGFHRIHENALTQSKVKAAMAYWEYLGLLGLTSYGRLRSFISYVSNTVVERLL